MLKLDLVKAYDCIDQTFLKLALYRLGLTFNVVDWIMPCILSVHFAILINGIPSTFFKATRGLRQDLLYFTIVIPSY